VYYAGPATRQGDALERVRDARRAAAKYGAIATFWLDAPATRPWQLYAADAGITRVVVRRLASGRASVEANIEGVALIVRATTDALLHGEPLPAEEVSGESEAQAPWPVERLDEGNSAVRISAAYSGNTFAPQRHWQHGLSLKAAWIWPSGPYVGVGYTILPNMQFDTQSVRFEVERHPISLHAGLRFRVSPWTFTGELGAELEIRKRRTLATMDTDQQKFDSQSPDQTQLFNICPKLEAELSILEWLVLFGGAGLDFVIGNFPYNTHHKGIDEKTGEEVEMTSVLVEPYLIRLTTHVGLAVMF
jgi:hypothetical protein